MFHVVVPGIEWAAWKINGRLSIDLRVETVMFALPAKLIAMSIGVHRWR